jgi:hypothetical protein
VEAKKKPDDADATAPVRAPSMLRTTKRGNVARLNMWIPIELVRELDETAIATYRDKSSIVAEALKEYFRAFRKRQRRQT